MSNLIPGNQKHLTLDNRIFIEKSLDNNLPFKVIAKYLCKDPTTVSKEVKKHRSLTSRNNFVSHNHCVHRGKCGLTNVCKRTVACKKQCRTCNACNTHCDQFKNEICSKVLKAPFVCNGCSKKAGCRLDKYFYKATQANRQYKTILVESRNGINISEDSLNQMDAIVTPLILQGQTPYQILKNHPEIKCSEKTIYNYIASGVLSVKNIDLPRKVKYKPRKQDRPKAKDTGIFEGRTYNDFMKYMEAHPETNVVEMDTVVGCEGSRKVLLTLFFRSCKLMLIYLLPDKTATSVKKTFDHLEEKMSPIGFYNTFPVILTDRGTEFSNPEGLECGIDNTIRTSIFFCDPMASWQKPGIEKNHEYIRSVLPKGSSFDKLTQWDVTRLANHINSTARASLNGRTPLELAQLLLEKHALNAFGLREISCDDIILKPKLLK
ncbi:IS30 family transposase [Ruminiclostridium josui]|uniref:IS30 family transposase n=2 Tax=Ruminiclostridium josui TaxID=1499 RepID=UPI000463A6CF|nr:IS30 family transposase [Ruminiclostridium josui]